jgi:pyrroloquinoline quinone biosynthesis protein E
MSLRTQLNELRFFYRIFSIRGSLFRRLRRLTRLAAEMRDQVLTPSLPVRLQVETTDTCNLKCVMCAREVLTDMNQANITLETFQNLIQSADPYYVTMNGLGEPLIDETTFEKLSYLHDKMIITSMPTNGTFVFGERLEKLAEHLPDRLCMSIDGAKKETFESVRRLANFEKIVTNYRALCRLRAERKTRQNQSIYILCALQKINMHDYREMFELYSTIEGVDNIYIIPVTDYGIEGESLNVCPTEEEVKTLHEELKVAMAHAQSTEERAFYEKWRHASCAWLDAEKEEPLDPETNTHACLLPWFSTYVDAKGRVYPCCYLTNTDHVMGNVNEKDFLEVWHGEEYMAFRKAMANDRPNLKSCRNCPRNDDSRMDLFKRLGPMLQR